MASLKTILRFNVHLDALIRIKQIDEIKPKKTKTKALNSHNRIFIIEEGKTKLKDFSSWYKFPFLFYLHFTNIIFHLKIKNKFLIKFRDLYNSYILQSYNIILIWYSIFLI